MTKIDDAKQFLSKGFEKSLSIQQPLAKLHVARLRRVHPDKTPGELIEVLNRWYLLAVTSSGAGVGAAAAAPAVGLPASIEPPRRVRRLQALGRLESWQGTHRRGIRLS